MIYINGRFLTQKLTGVQRFAFEMVKGLFAANSGEFMILMPPGKINEAYTDVDKWPIKVIGKLTNTFWEQIDLPTHLKKIGKPLLLNLVNTAPCFYKNQIASIMDMTTFVDPTWFSAKFSFYYKFIVPLFAKNAAHILTISESSKSDILKYLNIPEQKVTVIYCAVAEKFLEPKRDTVLDQKLLSKLGLKPKSYLLGVSSLDPRKNFKGLINAFLEMKLEIPLVIVGSKGKVFADEDLKNTLIENQSIIFTGYVEDSELIALYRYAKCFVYPSLYEGFGMPPLEAMASDCPTIVSNTSSMPEVCGDASLYVDPLDILSIMEKIDLLINDNMLREKLIILGRERCRRFSWKESALKLREVIDTH